MRGNEAERLSRQVAPFDDPLVLPFGHHHASLTTTDSIRRFVKLAVVDTLILANTVNRDRTLAHHAQRTIKLLDHAEHEDRIQARERGAGTGRLVKGSGRRR